MRVISGVTVNLLMPNRLPLGSWEGNLALIKRTCLEFGVFLTGNLGVWVGIIFFKKGGGGGGVWWC